MELSEDFWSASLDEIKQGYKEEKNAFICLLCGRKIEKGVIYPHGDLLYEAKRYMHLHIENAHLSVFEYLIGMNKKFTGLTDHQKSLLRLFYQGKSDIEVQKELGIGSTSTIRHHRFALKEKERQAKTLLAIMDLLRERDKHAPAFIPVHKTATMVDDRYNITEEEREKIISSYFPQGTCGPLSKFPSREKQKIVVLREISKQFKDNYFYSEKELNQELKRFYEDYSLIRRYLIEYGLLERKPDGSEYWLKK